MKKILGSLKNKTSVIVALILNIMIMITLFQLQPTFPSPEIARMSSEWSFLYRKRDQNIKETLVL